MKNRKYSTLQENFKIPPYSLEAEQSILGALMLDNERWDDIIEKINFNDFFHHSHQLIFKEMHNLLSQKKPIDLITLSEALSRKNHLENIGGFSYLAELSKNIPCVSNIEAYVDIVREKSITRKMVSIGHEIANNGYNPKGKNVEELLDIAEAKIFQITEEYVNKDNPQNVHKILKNTIEYIEHLYNHPNNGIIGIPSGYWDLDQKILGLQKSDLIIIAARPSMGKTTFAINICENIAINRKKPVLIFSLEMSSNQIMIKILSSLSRVDHMKIRTGRLNNQDWKKISKIIKILNKKNNIYIDDSSELTPRDIKSKSRRLFRENQGLSIIMIDYLQLMKVPYMYENRNLEITEISRSLKSLAKELKVPIIALSQLNRGLEQRADKRPINSDLRESGSIEQDADLILFIYRDEIYNAQSKMKGIAEIILGKQRNGPIGTILLTFNGELSRFDNYISSKKFR